MARVEDGHVVHLSRDEPVLPKTPADTVPPLSGEGRDIKAAPGDDAFIKDFAARQAVADQQARQLTEESVRKANRMVRTAPDDAHDELKRTLDSVRNNPDISEKNRVRLSDQLERTLQGIDRQGSFVKREQANQLALKARADALTSAQALEQLQQDRIRERLRVFHNLMNQARQDLAYQQAEAIRADLVVQGRPIPQAVTAAYQIGLVSYHVREIQDLKRLREERFLATMLQVEKSHMPFPDEPGITFPSDAIIRSLTHDKFDNWAEFSKYRIERYAVGSFGDIPKHALELRKQLSKTVRFGPLEDPKTTLAEVIDQLQRRYDLPISVNEAAFRFDGVMDIMKTEVIGMGGEIKEMRASLASVLKKILGRLSQVPSGATYIIRRDEIEITTGQFQLAEKTLRVYPVADLVFPFPSPGQFIQQQFLNQTGGLGVFGGVVGITGGLVGLAGGLGGGLVGLGGGLAGIGGGLVGLGGGLGGLGGGLGGLGGGIGGLGGLGGLGGGLGGLGGGIGGLGGLGGLGGGLGGLGGGLGGLGGGLGGLGGGLGGGFGGGLGGGVAGLGGFGGGFAGAQRAGVSGGYTGFQGQVGLGGNQSQALVTLIRQVVGQPKDWLPQFDPISGLPISALQMGDAGGMDMSVPGADNNNLGFYPPANALVVKGTSRIHFKSQPPVPGRGPGMGPNGQGMADKAFDRFLADAMKKPGVKVANELEERPDKDPRKIWEEALAKGVDNPGLIVAVADYLALNLKWDHAAEFLKANLRRGIVVKPWVYEALAVALRESGGSTDEIERAEVSNADLSPQDANGFLKASQAMANSKRYDRAVAFCKQASALEPNLARPYAEALLYAELAQDSQGMQWAAGNLLRQDWPYNNKLLQSRAEQKLDSLARALEKKNRIEDKNQMLQAVAVQRQRDLVVELHWQGEADLDLKVTEPSGSACSPLNRQSVGGGILIGDSLADMTAETYLAAQAFAGEYQIDVNRVWGHPLADRAQVKVIQHQGTPQQHEDIFTVDLKTAKPIKFVLATGRRTETAYVPPPQVVQASDGPTALTPESPDRILNQLRALSDPEVTGFDRGFGGGAAAAGQSPLTNYRSSKVAEPSTDDRVLTQQKVSSFVKNSVEMTAQAVLSADRRTVRVSVTPVFSTLGNQAPVINNPAIPGGR